MNILSVDTTTKTASVALKKECINSSNIYIKNVSNEITHSEKLLPLVHDVLSCNGLEIKDIDMLCAVQGPGSFTGIRIGLSTVKAFAQVLNLDICAVSSTEAMAYETYKNSEKYAKREDAYVLSLIDAKNNRVYFALYKMYFKENKLKVDNMCGINNLVIEEAMDNVVKYILVENSKNERSIEMSDMLVSCDSKNKFDDIILDKLKCKFVYNIYPDAKTLILFLEDIKDKTPYMKNAYTLDANYARETQAERVLNGKV